MHVDRGWLEEGITLGQSAVAGESSVSNRRQGDKVHRTVRRLLFVSRATGAARDEQLREHKTFLKASRWANSRAATGRGAGRAGCRFARARVRAEWLCQQQQAPPDMMTGQSIRTCLRREVPTDHEAHSHTQRGQLRERVSYALSNRASLSQVFFRIEGATCRWHLLSGRAGLL